VRTACLVTALGAALAPAALAGPKPASARFRATVSGGVTRLWTASQTGACTSAVRVNGRETLTFRSRGRSTITVARSAKGLVFRGRLAPLAGGFSSIGWSTEEPSACNPQGQVSNCVEPDFGFGSGSLVLQRAAPGRLALVRFAHEGQLPGRCVPAEAAGGEDAPLASTTGAVDERKLFNPRVKVLTVRGGVERLVQLAGDAEGQVFEEVQWTLTLQRLR
jgi:hypothetical protein